jgi:peroxiredoxin Q/BCP
MGLFGASTTPLTPGTPAPDFELQDQDGQALRLSSLRGKKVILFFYPKDNTPVCTMESCRFRDEYDDLVGLGAEVVGISNDTSDSHKSFAGKHRLQYRLLADPGGTVRAQYGVAGGMMPGRVTFVIDREGVIRHLETARFSAARHVDGAKAAVAELS